MAEIASKAHAQAGISKAVLKRLVPLAGVVAFLLVWEIATRLLKVPLYLLPPPSEIFRVFIENFSKLVSHGWITTYEMMLGYILAVGVAVPLAIGITSYRRFDAFITPTLLFFQVVPKIAIAPLFLVWFGVGTLPKVLVAFLISFFPIVIDTAVGLRSIAPRWSTWLVRWAPLPSRCSRNFGCQRACHISSAA